MTVTAMLYHLIRLLFRVQRNVSLVLVATGCHAVEAEQTSARAHVPAASSPPSSNVEQPVAASTFPHKHEELAPLVKRPWMVSLSDEGRTVDVATLPLGTTERRPVVVAVHGAGDRPNWACGGWRIALEAYAFVACPSGLPMSAQTFGWSNTQSIQNAIERTLAALHREFSVYVADGPMIYVGFSQGATLAGPLLIANAKRFPVAVLAEGGYNYLSDARFARAYLSAGGQRVMIVCGTAPCFSTAARAKAILESAGLTTIISGDRGAGHNLNARMQDALRRDWQLLIHDLPGWETFAAHRWPAPSRTTSE